MTDVVDGQYRRDLLAGLFEALGIAAYIWASQLVETPDPTLQREMHQLPVGAGMDPNPTFAEVSSGLAVGFFAVAMVGSGVLLIVPRTRPELWQRATEWPIPYLLFAPAYACHERAHALVASSLGASGVGLTYDDEGRPGAEIEPGAMGLRAQRVAALAPTLVGVPMLLAFSPWVLAALEPGPGLIDSVARLLIGAQLVVFALPSTEDIALAMVGFELQSDETNGRDRSLVTDGGES